MKKRLLYLILPIITLVLELLPYGAVCVFAPSPTERIKETFSYFDFTPLGFANFAPLITALLTCVTLLLLVIFCVTGKMHWLQNAKKVACAAAVISFGPFVYGIRYFSLVGLLISITLIAEFFLIPNNLNISEKPKE